MSYWCDIITETTLLVNWMNFFKTDLTFMAGHSILFLNYEILYFRNNNHYDLRRSPMKAAVYKGEGKFKVEDVPLPELTPDQVLVKVKYCAICGTDVHTVLYDVLEPDSVMGHEYCGTIADIGKEVTKWKIGDRVVGGGGDSPPGVSYGIMGDPRFSYQQSLAQDQTSGAYAEYVCLQEWEPMSIPDEVSDRAAAMCEPCAIAVHAVRNSRMQVGDSVAILGAGPVGLLCLQVAKAAGAGSVYVSEPAPARRRTALELGADEVIDPSTEDAVDRMISLTGGLGPHIVFECAAAKNTLDQGLTMARRFGQVVLVAIAWKPTSVLPVEWLGREVEMKASASKTPEDWARALELIRTGKVRMEPLLSDTSFVPLSNIQQSFESLFEPKGEVKIVVEPWAT